MRCHALLAVLCPFVRPWKSPIELLGRLWDALVGWDQGRFWPIPAALLPACIPLARSLQENSPASLKGITVAALLFSIAFLQTYGQARNKRERKAAEDRFNDQSAAINAIAAGVVAIADAANRVESRFNDQSAAINAIAAEAVKQGECLREQSEQMRDIVNIRRSE